MGGEDTTTLAVERTEVGGLTTFTAGLPPMSPTPTTAALTFRVGRADESLARLGLTHIVEHLAMFAAGDMTFQANALVDDTRTMFYASGEPEEVGGFLGRIAKALADLPLERLELEKRVLETESEAAPPPLIGRLLSGRFGARTYGLSKYREFGLRTATADDVTAWARERFTRGNAVLWVGGEMPAELALELPDGPRHPPPPATPLPRLNLPLYLEEGTGGAAAGFVLPRHYSSTLGLSVALERLRRRLRVERAVSYSPDGSYVVLTGDVAHASLAADALEDHVAEVRDEIVRVVDELGADGPTDDELAREKALAEKGLADAGNVLGRLDGSALGELIGHPLPSDDELRAELVGVTPEAIAEGMREARASMVLIAPVGLEAPPESAVPWGARETPPVEGRRFRQKRTGLRRGRAELVVGDEGITLYDAEGKPLTILFDECELVEEPEPGMLLLNAVDESFMEIATTALRDGDEFVALVRAGVPEWKFLPKA